VLNRGGRLIIIEFRRAGCRQRETHGDRSRSAD
jgi:hypothetical protein